MQYLVLENNFTALTTNSIEQNMPDAEYKVVPDTGGRIENALKHCTDITMVVTGGIILNIKEGDLPPDEVLGRNHLACSREAVFIDHPRHKVNYEHIGSPLHSGVVDMSLFIINPTKWEGETNFSKLSDKKIIYMPRYMNHRDDPTVAFCMGGYDIMEYGSIGEEASVLNYLTHLYSGVATPRDTWGYCFDLLLPYTEGLGEEERKLVERLGKQTKRRVGKLRRMVIEKEKSPD